MILREIHLFLYFLSILRSLRDLGLYRGSEMKFTVK